jgi:protein-S-isoprenylcysteine O-methyltransferase Ste14
MGIMSKIIFGIILLCFIAIRLIFAIIAQKTGLNPSFEYGKKTKKTNGVKVIPLLIIVLILVSIVLYFVIPVQNNFLVITLPDWLVYLGAGIGALSLIFQIVIHVTLQKNWSSAKAEKRSYIVIRSGLYSRIRHPLYLSLIVLLIGFALITVYIPFIIMAICSVPFFSTEAKKEEEELKEKGGEEYEAYCKKAGRLLPKIMVTKR